MSDGIAKHDWRELRKKTLAEIEEHRNNPKRDNGYVKKIHMTRSAHSLCGHGFTGDTKLTLLRSEVTCWYCKRILKFSSPDYLK